MHSDDAHRPSDSLTRTSTDPDQTVLPAVVRAVAAVDNVPVADLPPLYEAIDPDALNALLQSNGFDGHVTFEYADHAVRVESDGSVSVFDELPEH